MTDSINRYMETIGETFKVKQIISTSNDKSLSKSCNS